MEGPINLFCAKKNISKHLFNREIHQNNFVNTFDAKCIPTSKAMSLVMYFKVNFFERVKKYRKKQFLAFDRGAPFFLAAVYIYKILPIALKCGNDMMGDNWMFQQDGASPHIHKKRS